MATTTIRSAVTFEPEQANRLPEFEPYFLQWDSVLFQPEGRQEQIPLYVHKACGMGYHTKDKIPKRVCPMCGIDTSKEPLPEGIILP